MQGLAVAIFVGGFWAYFVCQWIQLALLLLDSHLLPRLDLTLTSEAQQQANTSHDDPMHHQQASKGSPTPPARMLNDHLTT